MKHSTWALLLVVFLVGAMAGFQLGRGGSGDESPTPTPLPTDGVMCPADARECPDGSYVGRVGPRCDFAQCPDTRRVSLFYYDLSRDKDSDGNVLCSAQGVVPVPRDIPITKTPIGDTIRLLLKGELTADEKAAGLSTEYPLAGFSLSGASLKDGVLTLSFNDPGGKTTGGSCRVGILWAQIENTARQFEEVASVRFVPDSLFQP